jgi:hypothetical protein
MGDDQLALFSVDKNSIIARALIQIVRKKVSIDWTVKESARARIRIVVKRILRKYGYGLYAGFAGGGDEDGVGAGGVAGGGFAVCRARQYNKTRIDAR